MDTRAQSEPLTGFADLHVHTTFSDGEDSPLEVVEHARKQNLQAVAITDHDSIDGAILASERAAAFPEIALIVGEEVSTRDGHVIGIFLTERVRPGMPASVTVAAIHEQGGLAIAAHPYWRTRPRAQGWNPHGVGDLIHKVPFDAVEVINGGFTPSMVYANILAGGAARRASLPMTGGSDAHVKQAIGWAVTAFVGRTAADLRSSLLAGRTRARLGKPNLVAVRRYVSWGLALRNRAVPDVA